MSDDKINNSFLEMNAKFKEPYQSPELQQAVSVINQLAEALQAMLRVSGLTDSEPGYSISEADKKGRETLSLAEPYLQKKEG